MWDGRAILSLPRPLISLSPNGDRLFSFVVSGYRNHFLSLHCMAATGASLTRPYLASGWVFWTRLQAAGCFIRLNLGNGIHLRAGPCRLFHPNKKHLTPGVCIPFSSRACHQDVVAHRCSMSLRSEQHIQMGKKRVYFVSSQDPGALVREIGSNNAQITQAFLMAYGPARKHGQDQRIAHPTSKARPARLSTAWMQNGWLISSSQHWSWSYPLRPTIALLCCILYVGKQIDMRVYR